MASTSIWKKAERISYNNCGTLNESAFPQEFVEICKKSQNALKQYVYDELGKYYEDVKAGNGWVYVKGTCPVILTAHMDTVHKEPVKDFWGSERADGKHIISSPQGIGGDDRCGVYMILNILETTDMRPTIIFCEDEEIGGIGSDKFLKEKITLPLIKFFIELDRGNGNDLVFYDDDNYEFADWCEEKTGYKTAFGSFSDISHFCPAYGISGVNISCGYYNAHTTDEYVVLEEMINSIAVTKELMKAAEDEKVDTFEYVEYKYSKYSENGYWNDRIWNDAYTYNSIKKEKKKNYMTEVIFYYLDENYSEHEEVVTAEGFLSAAGAFLLEHPELRWADVFDYDVM